MVKCLYQEFSLSKESGGGQCIVTGVQDGISELETKVLLLAELRAQVQICEFILVEYMFESSSELISHFRAQNYWFSLESDSAETTSSHRASGLLQTLRQQSSMLRRREGLAEWKEIQCWRPWLQCLEHPDSPSPTCPPLRDQLASSLGQ